MNDNIYIKARSDNRVYKTEPGKLGLVLLDEILYETEQGQETGTIIDAPTAKDDLIIENIEATIIRKLTDKDKETILERKKEALETINICKEKIKKHGLLMDLLDADISYDGKKLTFYFSAPGRVDFRSLVPDLASVFKKLIRLQQVSSRDKAKCLHGVVGRCGRDVCCKCVNKNNEDVSIEMANIQNIGQMGANRVTGACGKLMCCLKFELQQYEELKKNMPGIGSELKTAEGVGTVISQNMVKGSVTVELKNGKKIVEVSC